jgi:hypothetical protein
VTTSWSEAVDHVDTRNDQKFIDFLANKGILVGVQPTDDIVRGWPAKADALKPGVRYTARAWFEDKRLAQDSRIKDRIWLQANKVREIDGNRVLLFEYPFIASHYERFSDIANAYEGSWFKLASSGYDAAAAAAIVGLSSSRGVAPSPVKNASADFVGWFLAHGRPDLTPDSANVEAIADALERMPGYSDDILLLDDAQIGAIKAVWSSELQSFSTLGAAMGVDRSTEPFSDRIAGRPGVDTYHRDARLPRQRN